MRSLRVAAIATMLIVACLFQAVAAPSLPLDPNDVNGFDRAFMNPYNEVLDKTALGIGAVAVLMPAVLLAQPTDQYLTIGVMYLETMAVAYGAKELVKLVVERPRPCMYFDDYPQSLVDNGKWNESFLSGHTTLAFAGASFASYVFAKYNPDSKWKWPVIATSYALAGSVAALRVASGNHFATDVLAGALLGTVIGIGVPALHTLLAGDMAVSASPFGLVFSASF